MHEIFGTSKQITSNLLKLSGFSFYSARIGEQKIPIYRRKH